jgi:hypothetical protein
MYTNLIYIYIYKKNTIKLSPHKNRTLGKRQPYTSAFLHEATALNEPAPLWLQAQGFYHCTKQWPLQNIINDP